MKLAQSQRWVRLDFFYFFWNSRVENVLKWSPTHFRAARFSLLSIIHESFSSSALRSRSVRGREKKKKHILVERLESPFNGKSLLLCALCEVWLLMGCVGSYVCHLHRKGPKRTAKRSYVFFTFFFFFNLWITLVLFIFTLPLITHWFSVSPQICVLSNQTG